MVMFATLLNQKILAKNSRVCVGLDPRLEWLPQTIKQQAITKFGKTFRAAAEAIWQFNCEIIKTVADLIPVIKPQIAFYEQYGPLGLQALQKTIECAHEHDLLVILDAKRSDISSTAQAYAQAFLGQTQVFDQVQTAFNADALTINPFLGQDSLEPFIKTAQKHNKGLFILVKTSNPGSQDLQDLKIDQETVSEKLAKQITRLGKNNLNQANYSSLGAVVGATYPKQAKKLRKMMPHSIWLVPGFGPQGGNLEQIHYFFNQTGLGAIINSSRGITFSKKGKEGPKYLDLIRENTLKLKNGINQSLKLKV